MSRPISLLAPWTLALGPVALVVQGCLTGEVVDLGSNYDDCLPGDAGADAATAAEAAPVDAEGDGTDQDTGAIPTTGSPLCLVNGSFEPSLDGTDAAVSGPELAVPPGWVACQSQDDESTSCGLEPTDGQTYLGLSLGLAPFVLDTDSVDTALCEALHPDTWYSLAADVALDAPLDDGGTNGEPPALQILGGTSECASDAVLLVRFSAFAAACTWRRLCAVFRPTSAFTHLVLRPEASNSTATVFAETHVLVDHMTSGGPCTEL